MLYREDPTNTFSAWSGAPIDKVVYPLAIETLWSERELSDIGLYVPVDPGVPEGKIATGLSVKRIEGVVTMVYELEDAPVPAPADYRLTKRQICAALIVAGITTDPEAWMLGLLDNIVDATTRALAVNDWRNAPYYDRSNALFSDAGLMAAAGLTEGQIDALWMAAKDLPA